MIDTAMLGVGLLGIGLFQSSAPKLHELRQGTEDDTAQMQALIDAAIPATFTAVAIAICTLIRDKGNPTTALIFLSLVLLYFYWYYIVAKSPSI